MPFLPNSAPAQAYKGQSVIITVPSELYLNLSKIYVGEIMQINSSGKLGIVSEIDVFGNSYKISPLQPDLRFDSDATPGILGLEEINRFD